MSRSWVTSDAYERMVRTLVEARLQAELTQRDLAQRLGKPRSYVSKIETKERRLDLVEFVELAEALGIDPIGLFTRIIQRT